LRDSREIVSACSQQPARMRDAPIDDELVRGLAHGLPECA